MAGPVAHSAACGFDSFCARSRCRREVVSIFRTPAGQGDQPAPERQPDHQRGYDDGVHSGPLRCLCGLRAAFACAFFQAGPTSVPPEPKSRPWGSVGPRRRCDGRRRTETAARRPGSRRRSRASPPGKTRERWRDVPVVSQVQSTGRTSAAKLSTMARCRSVRVGGGSPGRRIASSGTWLFAYAISPTSRSLKPGSGALRRRPHLRCDCVAEICRQSHRRAWKGYRSDPEQLLERAPGGRFGLGDGPLFRLVLRL
jgi:hypothetical protein